MIKFSKNAKHQIRGFVLTIIASILCISSTGHTQWRVWHFKEANVSKPSVAFVALWRVCIYHRDSNSTSVKVCCQYTYHDTFIPLDITVYQHLMLVSTFLGMISTVSTVIFLWNIYTGSLQKKAIDKIFCVPGILNIITTSLISIIVLINYLSVIRKFGITFPPSLCVPSSPDTQSIESGMIMAGFSAFFFLLSVPMLISFTFPMCTRVRIKSKFPLYKAHFQGRGRASILETSI